MSVDEFSKAQGYLVLNRQGKIMKLGLTLVDGKFRYLMTFWYNK